MTPTTATTTTTIVATPPEQPPTHATCLGAGDVLAGGAVTELMSDSVLIDLARSSHRRVSELASRAAAAVREALIAVDAANGEPDITSAGVLELGRLELQVRAPVPKITPAEATARIDAMATGNKWLRVRGAPTIEEGEPATLCVSVSVLIDHLAAETRRRRAKEAAETDSMRAAYEQLKGRVETLQRRVAELADEKARAEERLAAAERETRELREQRAPIPPAESTADIADPAAPRTAAPVPVDFEAEIVAEIVRFIRAAGGSVDEIGTSDIERLYPSAARALRNVRDADGKDLLAHTVFHNVKPDRVRMLLGEAARYDVNRQDAAGNTALHYGMRRLLCSLDATMRDGDPDVQRKREAVVADCTAILRTLLSHPQLDPTLRNAAGMCPVAYAVAHSNDARARKRLWTHLRAAHLTRAEMSRMCQADAHEMAAREAAKRTRARAAKSRDGVARKRARPSPRNETNSVAAAPDNAGESVRAKGSPDRSPAAGGADGTAPLGDSARIATPGASDAPSESPAATSEWHNAPPPTPEEASKGEPIVTPSASNEPSKSPITARRNQLSERLASLAGHGQNILTAYIVLCCWKALGATASDSEREAFADAATPFAVTIEGVRAAARQSPDHATLATRYPHLLTDDNTLRVFLDAVRKWADANPDPPRKYQDRLAMSRAIISGQPSDAGVATISGIVKTMRHAVRATMRDMEEEITRAICEFVGTEQ